MKYTNSILILFLFIMLYSCEKELDYNDLNFKPKIVLNGLIYQDSVVKINVARTKSILEADTVLPFLKNAEVKLYKNDELIDSLLYDTLGQYYSTIKTKANTSYKIEAKTNEIETAIARFSFKNPINFKLNNIEYQIRDTILNIDEPVKADTNLFKVLLNFVMVFKDNADEENYYDFNCNGRFYSYIHSYTCYGDCDEMIESYVLEKNSSEYLYFRNYNDNEKYYPDGRSSYNGYESNMYISDKLINGTEVTFSLGASFYTNKIDSVSIILLSYPDEYIYFHKTGYIYISAWDNPFSQPINIYSNVENGLGIVCAVSRCKQGIYLSY